MLLNPILQTNKVCNVPRHNFVSGLCPFVLCPHFQECFSPLMDIDSVPEGPKHIPPYISRNRSSLGELFLGFLAYYATNFRYLLQTSHYRVSCFRLHPWFLCRLIFLLPFLISCSSGQLLLPLQFSVSPLLTLSYILFSGFIFLAEGQEQVGPLALQQHQYGMPRSLFVVC